MSTSLSLKMNDWFLVTELTLGFDDNLRTWRFSPQKDDWFESTLCIQFNKRQDQKSRMARAKTRAPFLQNRDARVATSGAEECDRTFFFPMDPTITAGSRYSLNFNRMVDVWELITGWNCTISVWRETPVHNADPQAWWGDWPCEGERGWWRREPGGNATGVGLFWTVLR